MHDRTQYPFHFRGAMHPAMWLTPSALARRASPPPAVRARFLVALAFAAAVLLCC